jgi:lysozyme family protein
MTRQELFDSMIIRQDIKNADGRVLVANVPAVIKRKTATMLANKERYAAIARRFVNPGLKWWLVAVIHEMEATQNFNCYLGNGQPWNQKTTIVPIGRGPFKSFEEGAIDALRLKKANEITDWSMNGVLYFLEGFNGYGYTRWKNMNSPYLWSGSNHYTKGKYVSDGAKGWDPEYVSRQIGIALLLKEIINK